MFKRLFSRSRFDATTHDLYDTIVAQARQPVLYTDLAVPDTLDGRFDLVVLHAILVLRRLRKGGEDGAKAAQAVFDIMFADFDRSLREIGVGDLKVGKKIKQMAQAFYGRAQSYGAALDSGEAQVDVLRRNLYGTSQPTPAVLEAAAAYVRGQERHLAALADSDLLAGRLSFAPAPLPRAGNVSI
ncbi:MAG: ubiquinol-cytochrome C chaperone family protein [Proteobacteria bacterium]|nr:ubiquinol-cytochrome C chaperone family protein [Pseudomonadota bacterium]